MSRSDKQIDEYLDALISLSRKVGKGKGEERLYSVEQLAQRFTRARTRDKTGSAIPDGYPRGSSMDGPGGGMQFEVAADRFEGESRIGLTSVELAIEQRVFSQRTVKDHHHDLYLGAEADLERAVRAIDEMRSKLARIDNLVDENPDAANAPKGCRSHARVPNHQHKPTWESDAREVGGRNGLCRFCYDWTQDHDGVLPPVEVVELLIRKGRRGLTTKEINEVTRPARKGSAA